jgi:RHS repeat-associated protein
VDYNAKGQRVLIVYGNGARTSHAYDPLTFRLTHLLTCRDQAAFPDDCPQPPPSGWPGCQIQRLTYTYDAKGNITHIRDDAQQTIFFRGRRVEPSSDYTYDAVYRLIEAAGREHLGQVGGSLTALSHNDEPRVSLPHPGDGNAMGRYAERYTYDVVGNILAMQHRGADSAQPAWTRSYSYDEPSQLQASQTSNRLSRTEVGETIERYRYDGSAGLHGNMTSMPHLPLMQWDFRDRLQATARQVVKDGTPETTWYVYDAAGLRVRKVTERHAPDGRSPGRSKERIYLGGFEIYREYESDAETVNLARETLHVMGGQERVALVETRTHGHDPSPAQLIRYQLGNHLGSVCLELDAHAQIISCEEYTPYGSSSYQAVRSRSEAPKRYRFTGKERDEESGLGYHGARYYAPWLGRWASPDPAGLVDGANVYAYARDNPLSYADASGTQCDPETQTCIDPAQPTPREQALQQSLPDDERDEPPPDDQSSTPPADLSSSNQSASTSLTISTSQYAISVLVRPVDVNGQPVKGTYYLWSGELNKDAAKAMIAKEGGWLMSQTPEHVVAAGQFAAALRREAATLFPGQAFTDQELFAKAGTEIRLSDAEMSAIWDAPSADIARRAVVGGLPVQGNLVTPPGPKTVQTRIEGPTVGEAGTLMGGVQIFAGGLNVYGATQEQDPALSTLGFVGGGLQIAGGATLIQGAVKLSGPAMAAGSRLALVGAVITAPITIAHATADLQSGDQYREMRGTLNMVGIVAPPAAFLATYNDVFVKPAAETFYETARRDIANMMGVPQSWVY